MEETKKYEKTQLKKFRRRKREGKPKRSNKHNKGFIGVNVDLKELKQMYLDKIKERK